MPTLESHREYCAGCAPVPLGDDSHHTGSHENTSLERSSGVNDDANAPLSCASICSGVQPSERCSGADRAGLVEQINLVVAHAEDLAADAVGAVGAEIDRKRRDLFRRHLAEAGDARLLCFGLGRDRVDHARPGKRRDAVRAHLEARHVERDAARQSDNAELGRHVIGLAEIADQPRGRGHVHVSCRNSARGNASAQARLMLKLPCRCTAITSDQSDQLMR